MNTTQATDGITSYNPELGQEKPDVAIEARLGHYGKHYFITTPLKLGGRGIEHLETLAAGVQRYKVTCNAFEKLAMQYGAATIAYLD